MPAIDTRADNVFHLRKYDTIVGDLCCKIGWEDVLDHEWAETALACASDELSPTTAMFGPGVGDRGQSGDMGAGTTACLTASRRASRSR